MGLPSIAIWLPLAFVVLLLAVGRDEHAGTLRWALLNQHLIVWIEPFTQALRSHAACAFYRQLGEITFRFVNLQLAPTTNREN